MIHDRETAARRAEASHSNKPGTCQLWTRTMFGAPSAGDRDHDGDSDAVDGWNSEPVSARHPGDRNPPRGVPVAWSGGRNGYGHRAISLGNGLIRSTDAGGPGVVATVDLGWVERNWGLRYLGWSETITGHPIPGGHDTEELDMDEDKLRKIIRQEARAAVREELADAADAIKIDVGKKAKWSLETVLRTLVNRKKRQES